ncbi:MAG TPA: uridine kinase [Candidatus Onthocola gallistercoris]|uniref:Uridine kinase n=1 Tax=Candidatus Onthocola gallistercoris TaxID=2840876 RepID=A0A9D1HF51_9FIRM|nr:uridine kinase [Candidatus Onthocola gallistercoris]
MDMDRMVQDIVQAMEKRGIGTSDDKIWIISVDGRAAAGKTTLAARLSQLLGASVIHMDDFFLPGMLRTVERLDEPGGNVHYERFSREVLPHLRENRRFDYRIFDCVQMRYSGKRSVENSRYRIVEGSYSNHPVFGDYADFRIFCDVDPEEQKERILRRNGRESEKVFEQKWIPMEEKYFECFKIREKADHHLVSQKGE